jgi:hypothetical protein
MKESWQVEISKKGSVSGFPQNIVTVSDHIMPQPPSWFYRLRTNKAIVDKTPVATTILLELANIGQLYRMWTTWTSDGQSVYSWLAVNMALWLWFNFYLVFNRANRFAIWGTGVGIGLNTLVLLSVIYFRYLK